jgi:hypothetical protein
MFQNTKTFSEKQSRLESRNPLGRGGSRFYMECNYADGIFQWGI